MHSIQDKIEYGTPLHKTNVNELVCSLFEYDLNSCYGYSASEAIMPGGFCMGYFNPSIYDLIESGGSNMHGLKTEHIPDLLDDGKTNRLLRMDGKREEGFEFKAVYYFLYKLQEENAEPASFYPVSTVFSNFHPFGVFQVKKCIVDLAVIGNDGSLMLINFDSAFSHSCETCPRLNRYINNKSHEQLRRQARDRDNLILQWIRSLPIRATYRVISECHDSPYKKSALDHAFRTISQLNEMIGHCPKAASLSVEEFLNWMCRHKQNKQFTFMAWVKGELPQHTAEHFKPIVRRNPDNPLAGHELRSDTGNDSILLIRDYFEYLENEFDFQVQRIDAILFFRNNIAMNRVFKQLIEERYQTTDKMKTQWLKRLINLSIGFFGLNENKRYSKYILTNAMPKTASVATHLIDTRMYNRSTQLGESCFFTLEVFSKSKYQRSTCRCPLPLNIAVVEYGKFRIVQFLNFLQKYIPSEKWRLVYSNIDNCQIACSSPSLEDAVPEAKRHQFLRDRELFIADLKMPGLMKLEWSYVNTDFSYISAFIQNHAIISSEQNPRAKLPGLKNTSPEDIFHIASQLLENRQVTVSQERRKDAISNLEVAQLQITLKPKL